MFCVFPPHYFVGGFAFVALFSQEETGRLKSKCDGTLANLEREAAGVGALKQGLDRRHRQAEKDAATLAARELEFSRWAPNQKQERTGQYEIVYRLVIS